MTDLIRHWLLAPTNEREVRYLIASGGVAVTLVYVLATASPYEDAYWAPALVALVLAWFLPRYAPWILGAAATVTATFTGSERVYFGWAVAALVFLALLEDPDERPKIGWLAGILGAALSLGIDGNPNLVPWAATAGGTLCAAPLLYRQRNVKLRAETQVLRGQASWLEQRTVLARELHDVVGHHVTAMVVQAEAGQVTDPHVALRTIADAGRTALRELDALVVHLRDPNATTVLSAPPQLGDIDELLAEPLRAQGVHIDVRIDPEVGLDEVGILTAYRIVQEALTNIAKHARANHAWVEIRRTHDIVRIRVSDDGVGPPSVIERGSGLVGVQERAAALGGICDLSTRPGGGTMLDVTLAGV